MSYFCGLVIPYVAFFVSIHVIAWRSKLQCHTANSGIRSTNIRQTFITSQRLQSIIRSVGATLTPSRILSTFCGAVNIFNTVLIPQFRTFRIIPRRLLLWCLSIGAFRILKSGNFTLFVVSCKANFIYSTLKNMAMYKPLWYL